MNLPKIEVFKGTGKQPYNGRLKGVNGEIQARGEGHTRKADAKRAAKAARRNMLMARIVMVK